MSDCCFRANLTVKISTFVIYDTKQHLGLELGIVYCSVAVKNRRMREGPICVCM